MGINGLASFFQGDSIMKKESYEFTSQQS